MKKLLVYGPLSMALVAALAVGIPAAVNADSSDAVPTETAVIDEQGPGQEIMTRAAEILGIDEETLRNAFRQATQEMTTERQQERLQNAVENGLITEDEATDIEEWWDSKPDCLQGLGPMGGQGPMGGGHQFMGRGPIGEPDEDYAFSAP